MIDWIESLVLGLVQGLTEFLPISSDGHLAVTQQVFAALRGSRRSASEDLFFDVMLHLGTLAAILAHYRGTLRGVWSKLVAADSEDGGSSRRLLLRLALLAVLATLPLVPDALLFKPWIERAFQSPTATAVGFLLTAGVLLVTTRLSGGRVGPAETRWWQALLVGIAQGLAPLPGVSRSGLTIVTALALGFTRSWAVGFSLLIAVPAILGAVVFEVNDLRGAVVSGPRLAQLVAATITAGAVGYLAIVWLVRIVRANRIWYFSVYLVMIAVVVLGLSGTGWIGGPDDGGSRSTLGQSRGVGREAARDWGGGPAVGAHRLAGADAPGP